LVWWLVALALLRELDLALARRAQEQPGEQASQVLLQERPVLGLQEQPQLAGQPDVLPPAALDGVVQ
jgi:hypothetical protein